MVVALVEDATQALFEFSASLAFGSLRAALAVARRHSSISCPSMAISTPSVRTSAASLERASSTGFVLFTCV
jgi:hypothetical protein